MLAAVVILFTLHYQHQTEFRVYVVRGNKSRNIFPSLRYRNTCTDKWQFGGVQRLWLKDEICCLLYNNMYKVLLLLLSPPTQAWRLHAENEHMWIHEKQVCCRNQGNKIIIDADLHVIICRTQCIIFDRWSKTYILRNYR